ncbi:OTU domain-containing protein 5-B-like [Oratosquilla oratoria]|uniref:OTU domain-containing protein 5-B-like n=1 Tax=Oratosquilla oratoria TaxID=337810 RepID=UPI003F758D21
MTILPKKKPQASNQAAEVENNDAVAHSSGGHHSHTSHQHQLPLGSLPSHLQNGESANRGGLYLNSQGSPPCWPPPASREEKRPSHSSPSHFDDALESGPSHSKRRYRASPLRSVRPKHREHRELRGNSSPPYPSTSSAWAVTPHSHQLPLNTSLPSAIAPALSPQAGPSRPRDDNEDISGYNSGDEHEPFGWNLTADQWDEKERWFEKKMKKKGFIIKKMREDGACLFRAIADQVYGDQDMHGIVRKQCMDHISGNEDMFAPFVSENFQTYVARKRRDDCYGNHVEIAAMSELFNRIIEVYCYSVEPINIFQGSLQTDNEPMRLTYHQGTHYNSLVDPYKATIGVGLGLPGFQPGLAEKNLMKEATGISENFHLEQAMLEDKIRATDFEATTEAIEEQVAHESYLEWLRENDKRTKAQRSPTTSPSGSGSGERSSRGRTSPLQQLQQAEASGDTVRASPRASPRIVEAARTSPRGSNSPRTSSTSRASAGSDCSRPAPHPTPDLAIPGSSKDSAASYQEPMPSSSGYSSFGDFHLNESASFLNQLPPDIFGLTDYSSAEADILAQVLAASQQEYLASFKNKKEDTSETS